MLHKIRWTPQKINQRLAEIQALEYHQRQVLPPFRFKALEEDTISAPPIEPDIDISDWENIPHHQYWGRPRLNFVLRTTFCIPPSWERRGKEALYLPLGEAGDFSHPEALAYIDGQPYAACDRHHQEIQLAERWCDGKPHNLALHGWTGIGGSTVGDPHQKLQMGVCEIVQVHQPTRDFIALARVASGIAEHLDDSNPAKHHLYSALNEAFTVLDLRIPEGEGFYDSLSQADDILRQGVASAGPPMGVDITAVGHAHIDVAWLWTLAQTRQKAGRTFHNVLRLMEEFPEFRFVQSQPQLYEFVREDFPELYESLRERVAEGRWEVLGGMWVEADCNLSGPESLARQFLLGRSFLRQQFGESAESPVLWLPDVFGYAWNLPQLIKSAGLEYFFTIKIGWSQYNRLPYDSFWWQGLDGTRVLTHFSTTKNPESAHAATYNADASPGQTLGTWFNFQQKDYGPPGVTPPLLMSYGWGDGGGGPTREMLENLHEMENFPGTPQIKPGNVGEFFRKLETQVGENLPVWNGELYLEYHRGTYTTHAKIKRANRKSEFHLHDAEFLAAYADLIDSEYHYPSEQFTRAWRLVCLNQFHDIITGTSIGPVYEDAAKQYKQVLTICEQAREGALNAIREHIGGEFLVINPSGFERTDLAFWPGELPDGISLSRNGVPITLQRVNGGVLIDAGSLPAYSINPLTRGDKTPAVEMKPVSASPTKLENAFLVVKFNQAGDIIQIFDKRLERDILPEGALANQFQAFEDRPLSWDAWDIDIFYDDKMWLSEPASSTQVVEAGPLRATLEFQRRILNSEYIQRISLTHNSARLDIETTIQWQERRVLLKTAFPVDILAPTATYEIQWGNVERPTHRNTSWDWARFETAAQKWVDLSEGDYGVSLLNDCKYGHDIHDNVMRLTLLRGTTAPDPHADLGEQHFTYSLLPHEGSWNERTIAAAYALNDPAIVVRGSQGEALKLAQRSLAAVQAPNVVIETIKQAEDGQGLIIRLYESQRKRTKVSLETSFQVQAAWESDIMEKNHHRLEADGNQVHFSIKPYQIKTLRLIPNKGKNA